MTTRFAPLLALSLATCVHAQTDAPVLETWEIALIAGSGSLALLMCVYSVYILRTRSAATPPVDVEMGTKKEVKRDVTTNAPAMKDAPKKDVPKKDATKKEATKKDAPKKDAPKMDATKKDAPKKDATKKDAPKMDAPKDVIVPGANKMPNRSHLKTYSKNANRSIDGGNTLTENVDDPGHGRKKSLRRPPSI